MSLGLSGLVVACTLTDDSFEPSSVSRVGGELSPEEESPFSPGAEGGGEANPESDEGSGSEQNVGGVPLDPGAAVNGRPGTGSSSGANAGGTGIDGDAGGGGADGTANDSNAGADAGVPPTSPSCGSSGPGASEFGGSCYQLFGDLAPWSAAEQRCIAWGGHLASVESAVEDDFISGWPALLGIPTADGSGVWLGGTDATLDGDFRWSSTGELSFESWAPSQPDNGPGVDCIEKRNDGTSLWYDRRCTDALAFVCERPL